MTDDKLLFPQYDAVPAYEGWVAFERALIKNGGTADDHGWSYADVFTASTMAVHMGRQCLPPLLQLMIAL